MCVFVCGLYLCLRQKGVSCTSHCTCSYVGTAGDVSSVVGREGSDPDAHETFVQVIAITLLRVCSCTGAVEPISEATTLNPLAVL